MHGHRREGLARALDLRHHSRMNDIPANTALERLKEGNLRFIKARAEGRMVTPLHPLDQPLSTQRPFAIVIGCSDSRVPVEIVFDQGLGDLFVVRVAGNVVMPSQLGSVEFAAEQFGTRLVVVLGHSGCGAIKATLGEIASPSDGGSPHLSALVSRIRPGIAPLLSAEDGLDGEALVDSAVDANVRAMTRSLSEESDILQDLATNDGLEIVGATYDLATSRVRFLDA